MGHWASGIGNSFFLTSDFFFTSVKFVTESVAELPSFLPLPSRASRLRGSIDLLHKSLIDTETADVRQINTDKRR